MGVTRNGGGRDEQPGLSTVPRHVAIIMDGNGRWAEHRGEPRLNGHSAGTGNIRRIATCAAQAGVSYLTLYAFSTENWARPQGEVQGLMGILERVVSQETEALHRQGVRLNHIGRMDRLASRLRSAICNALEMTRENQGLVLSVAFDYGGRDEILQAVRRIIADGLAPEQVTEETLKGYFYTSELPDPDLIVRTAGEMRLSNFLLWQAAYSEYFFSPVYWPDFDEAEFARALEAYRSRQRRFGGPHPARSG